MAIVSLSGIERCDMYIFDMSNSVIYLNYTAIIEERLGCKHVVGPSGWTPIPYHELPASCPIHIVPSLGCSWIIRSCTVGELDLTPASLRRVGNKLWYDGVEIPSSIIDWIKRNM